MAKIHVLADETLGGIRREYVEVERVPEVGDKVIVVSATESNELYRDGDVLTVKKYVEEDADNLEGIEVEIPGDIDEYFLYPSEYCVLEPTDIVHIKDEHGKWDTVRYRLVDRKAEVGERVLVKDGAQSTDECNHGKSFEVTEIDGPMLVYADGTHEDGSPLNLVNGDYFVLVPVESEKEATSPQSFEDLIANLATRMSAIERSVTALEDKHEAQAKQLADIERSTWYLEDDVIYAKEARYQLALEIREIKSQLKPENITEVVASALRKGD